MLSISVSVVGAFCRTTCCRRIFLIFFANGAIYATTTRHIDQHIGKEFNLIALSIWLFVGDWGSVLGSNTWMYAQNSVVYCDGLPGAHAWPHMCLE